MPDTPNPDQQPVVGVRGTPPDDLLAAIPDAIIVCTREGVITRVNAATSALFGYLPTELIGQPVELLVPRPQAEGHRRLRAGYVAAPHPRPMLTGPDVDGRHKDGRSLPVEVNLAGAVLDGRPVVVAAVRDVSVNRATAHRLQLSEERFRLSFERAPIGIALISVHAGSLGQLLQVNPALERLVGYSRPQLLAMRAADLVHPEDLPLIAATFDLLGAGEPVDELIELRYQHANGSTVWVQVSLATVLPGHDGADDPYVVAMITDITARKVAEFELVHNALHDPLTGLPNRALVTDHLARALARVRRTGAGVGLLYIDVDHFKDANSSLGRAGADELLVELAHRLAGCMADTEIAGRIGGDEFVVVCGELRELDEITEVAARVGQALAVQVPLAGQMVSVTASVGIAYTTSPSTRPEDLLREADVAMYRAKANGRARYEFSDPRTQALALRQIELEADLRATLGAQQEGPAGQGAQPPASRGPVPPPAVGRPRRNGRGRRPQVGRLFLDYQPCFDAGTGELTACEALLRWDHATKGLLAPGQFLDVAEDRALIAPLGAWVLAEAADQAAAWSRRFGDAAPQMWVNVSAGQMGRHRFAEQVARTLDRTGLPADRLVIELTERQALSSAHSVLDDLHALPTLGVALAIDDFGTGYAGLEYLRRLPVSVLKVDASYVAAIGQDATGAALAATVVNLGHALDLTVVAEGVETPAQRQAVTELGADVLQGFLLGRPGPPAQIDRLLCGQTVI